jgi:hypothetical protein
MPTGPFALESALYNDQLDPDDPAPVIMVTPLLATKQYLYGYGTAGAPPASPVTLSTYLEGQFVSPEDGSGAINYVNSLALNDITGLYAGVFGSSNAFPVALVDGGSLVDPTLGAIGLTSLQSALAFTSLMEVRSDGAGTLFIQKRWLDNGGGSNIIFFVFSRTIR